MERVLYVHGFTGGIWEAEPLQALWNLPVRGVPMPGHGGKRPGERVDFEAAVARVVEASKDTEGQMAIVGYSMGARVALAALLRHPQLFGGAVLVGVRPGLEDVVKRAERVELDERRASRLEELGVKGFMDWWETLPVIASQSSIAPAIREEMRRVRRDHWGPGLASSLREMGAGRMPSLWADLERLEVPTLLVTGERDEAFASIASEMVQRSHSIRHTTLENAGHCAHWEQPEAFKDLLLGFLETLG